MKTNNLNKLLIPRTPRKNWPRPKKVKALAQYTKDGRMIEAIYPNQKFPWGHYEQTGHAGAGIIIADTPKGEKIALVHQWRPTNEKSISLPFGNIGKNPEDLLEGMLREIREEIGEVEIKSMKTAKGFSHSQTREIMSGGGPKCFFPFIIKVKTAAKPKVYKEADEKTKSHWYTKDQIRKMVRTGKISDMPSCFFLLAAGIIKTEDFAFQKIEK